MCKALKSYEHCVVHSSASLSRWGTPEVWRQELEAACAYRKAVAETLHRVRQEPCFSAAAAECGRKITEAGGVQRTVDLLLQTVGSEMKKLPTLLRPNAHGHAAAVKECRVQA